MQCRALAEALVQAEKAGVDVSLEIMMPMTCHERKSADSRVFSRSEHWEGKKQEKKEGMGA